MLKKLVFLVALATAVFATPVSSRFDDPIPMCDPCPDPHNPPKTR